MNETKPQDPAFPNEFGETGLTKREYFAAMAMQGLLCDGTYDEKHAAIDAVKAADALIAELNKQPNS